MLSKLKHAFPASTSGKPREPPAYVALALVSLRSSSPCPTCREPPEAARVIEHRGVMPTAWEGSDSQCVCAPQPTADRRQRNGVSLVMQRGPGSFFGAPAISHSETRKSPHGVIVGRSGSSSQARQAIRPSGLGQFSLPHRRRSFSIINDLRWKYTLELLYDVMTDKSDLSRCKSTAHPLEITELIKRADALEFLGSVPHYREEAFKRDRASKAVGNQKFSRIHRGRGLVALRGDH